MLTKAKSCTALRIISSQPHRQLPTLHQSVMAEHPSFTLAGLRKHITVF